MTILEEAEDLFLTYLKTLPEDQLRNMHNGQDVINAITDDAEWDFKDELWEIVKRSIQYSLVLERAKEDLPEEVEEEEEESSSEED
jgi:hypothetical protein